MSLHTDYLVLLIFTYFYFLKYSMFSRILGKKQDKSDVVLTRQEQKAEALLRQAANVNQKIKIFTKKYESFLSVYFLGAKN